MDHSAHGSMSMSMDMGSPTATATGAMSSMTGMAGGHGGGGMGMGGGCKISMLWNWNTVDSCFISRSWHITSNGMFAGSCIGVILLVIALEFLRRAGKEYDRYIVNQYTASLPPISTSASSTDINAANKNGASSSAPACAPLPAQTFRPSILQQAVRALIHMLAFAVAYFVMLLAMYYNGYIIICIFIGAYLGYFIFGWESFSVGNGGRDRMQTNATVCCG